MSPIRESCQFHLHRGPRTQTSSPQVLATIISPWMSVPLLPFLPLQSLLNTTPEGPCCKLCQTTSVLDSVTSLISQGSQQSFGGVTGVPTFTTPVLHHLYPPPPPLSSTTSTTSLRFPLLPLLGMLIPQAYAWFSPSPLSSLCSAVTFSVRPTLTPLYNFKETPLPPQHRPYFPIALNRVYCTI